MQLSALRNTSMIKFPQCRRHRHRRRHQSIKKSNPKLVRKLQAALEFFPSKHSRCLISTLSTARARFDPTFALLVSERLQTRSLRCTLPLSLRSRWQLTCKSLHLEPCGSWILRHHHRRHQEAAVVAPVVNVVAVVVGGLLLAISMPFPGI